jgi:MYXO-CTERM domain-containing protein
MKMTARWIAMGIAAATASASGVGAARAQDNCTPSRLMVVLDKSSSMNGLIEEGGEVKWDAAVNALGELAAAYQDQIQLGLDVFPAADGECSTGEVVVEPSFGTQKAITAALSEAPPNGGFYTPMAQTLDAIAELPSMGQADVASYVVLVTDGWQYCIANGDPDTYDPATRFAPVESVERLNAAGITTFVVGFGEAVDVETLNMMAVTAGTGRAGCDPVAGTNCYYQADSPGELLAALMEVARQIPEEETCDGIDNNCNGQADENLTRSCATDCGEGSEVCVNGEWQGCDAPAAETCEPNECAGGVDENGECIPLVTDDPAGCGCQSGTGGGLGTLALALPVALVFGLRRRRRRGNLA